MLTMVKGGEKYNWLRASQIFFSKSLFYKAMQRVGGPVIFHLNISLFTSYTCIPNAGGKLQLGSPRTETYFGVKLQPLEDFPWCKLAYQKLVR